MPSTAVAPFLRSVRCPVLTSRMLLMLCAMSGTDIAYAATRRYGRPPEGGHQDQPFSLCPWYCSTRVLLHLACMWSIFLCPRLRSTRVLLH
eukprot:3350412-Rhodomonas_salina.1